ncbi:MAG: GcrA cell cycle regulator [Cohaesibacteraceae bacterium]|nr:GcrA cell cycle regulator [Cohaesibacteraceae bacterium]MBL4876654.1 GcrA cell cycle regulator [Cohaesibacteraceae bacterium]
MAWTDDRVALLKKLWSDGLSASQIAAELGGVTRNAVIGKVHRLGLSGRAKTPSTAARARKPRTASRPARPPSAPFSAATVVGNTVLKSAPQVAPRAAARPAVNPDSVVVPISKRATILTLTETTCKWPIGDPGDADFHFCGHNSKTGLPYCEYHAKVAYQPVSDRRKVKKVAIG